MIENFSRKGRGEDSLNISKILMGVNLSNEETLFLKKIKETWNFYEGYHWEGIDNLDTPQVTFNYCRAFVNKFVAFEFGKGFSIKTPTELDRVPVTINNKKKIVTLDENANDILEGDEVRTPNERVIIQEKTLSDYLGEVWEDNKKEVFLEEIGQTKSITGEAWVKVTFESPEDLTDIFEEYPNGRIKLSVTPTQYVFPTYNEHDKDKLEELVIMYPITKKEERGIVYKKIVDSTVIYKEVWRADSILVYSGEKLEEDLVNPYGFIPFVQMKNFPVAGRSRGAGDLEDVIPLNVELNTKRSDMSEVIDYHAAPITMVFGARIGNLEKGSNKVWGGLPKDARVENLYLKGDMVASANYIQDIKTSMCEVAGIPETVLGGARAISNTSGVALQYMNLPLIERTRVKKHLSKIGFQQINKMIIFISLKEGLIEKPDDITMKDFISNTVEIPDTLPKDELIELQKIQQELMSALESRSGAMERLGKTNIPKKIREIERERATYPEVYNTEMQKYWYLNNFLSSTNAGGMLNGQTPRESIRSVINGENKENK